jgi:ECF transporter S component (folate family)
MSKQAKNLRKIIVSAIFLAIALVIKTLFTIDIPMFGANGMRIGVSGIFSVMPSILFGPVYGAITGALSDLLGFLLKPTGGYIPLLTLTAALAGFLRGGIWFMLKKRSSGKIRIGIICVTFFLLAFGIYNFASLAADGVDGKFYANNETYLAHIDNITPEVTNQVTADKHLVSKMIIERTITSKTTDKETKAVIVDATIAKANNNLLTYIVTMTYGIAGSGVLGLILLIVDLIISKAGAKNGDSPVPITQLLIAALVSGLIVTTINTFILREFYSEAWKSLPFALVWIPRVVEEILSNIVNVYFVSVLYGVFNRQHNLRKIVE